MKNEITDKIKNIVCNDWKGRITGYETPLQLLRLFVTEPQVQEYCYEKNYPPIEQLEELKHEAYRFGIIINQYKSIVNPRNAFVFGDSVVRVKATDYWFCNIVATHNSCIEVKASGNSIVNVVLYGMATCIHHVQDNAKIHIIKK